MSRSKVNDWSWHSSSCSSIGYGAHPSAADIVLLGFGGGEGERRGGGCTNASITEYYYLALRKNSTTHLQYPFKASRFCSAPLTALLHSITALCNALFSSTTSPCIRKKQLIHVFTSSK